MTDADAGAAAVPAQDGAWAGRTVLKTRRLLLRTWRRDDLPAFAALNADPEVVEFLGGAPIPPEESDAIAAYAEELWATEGLGLLAVERREDGAFLGFAGLHRLWDWYPDDIEVAWRLAREHWGHGYATEAAEAWLAHGFATRGLARVISVTDRDPPHVRSIAVMRRLGMVWDHDAELVEDGVAFPAVVHSITAAQWRAARPDRGLPAT
jgi:RimJ/RimL family protein N-acetyltransferase